MLWLVPLAHAHVPHDLVAAVAIPADGDPATPWFVFLNPAGAWLWERSDDEGRTWNLVGGAPMGDTPIGAARVGDDLLILGASGVWASADEGESWELGAAPGDVNLVGSGPTGVVAGKGGLWSGEPGNWVQQLDVPIHVLGPGAALDQEGQLWAEGASWSAVGSPQADASAVLWDGAIAWVGARDGTVRRWDGAAWLSCGALPTTGNEYDDVIRLARLGSHVVATTSDGGPYATDETCAAWSVLGVDQNIDHGAGGPATEADAQLVLGAFGDTWIFGGWAGLFLSHDQGGSWTAPPLIPASYTRGVAFSTDWPTDPAMYVAAYAAGAQRTDDGGETWRSPGHGATETNAQSVRTSPHDVDTVYTLLNHAAFVSHNGGEDWVDLDPEAGSVDDIVVLPEVGRLWELGQQVRESLDDGATWTTRTDLDEAFEGARVTGYLHLDDRTCVTLGDPSGLACSVDESIWSMVKLTASGSTSTPVPWPAASPTHVIWGDADGIHRVAIGEQTATSTATEAVLHLVATPDDRLFLTTRSGAILRSDDGGLSWVELPERATATPMTLVARPDWDTHPELLLGSHAGLFRVDPDGAIAPIAYELVDDASSYLQCEACPPETPNKAADWDSRQPVGSGKLSVTLRGTRVVVDGVARAGDGVEVFVDGEDLGPHAQVPTEGTLVDIRGLEDRWHVVELVGLPQTDVEVDHVEAWGDGVTLDIDGAEVSASDPGCACGHGRAGGLGFGLGLLAPLARARRQRCVR